MKQIKVNNKKCGRCEGIINTQHTYSEKCKASKEVIKIKAKLIGSKKDGYILSVYNKEDKFKDFLCSDDDIALTHEELIEVKKVLDKKIK